MTQYTMSVWYPADVADLDADLAWADSLSQAATCPIEVRPFQRPSSA